MTKILEKLNESVSRKKIIESELLELIEHNPKFIYDELMKSDVTESFSNIFAPYINVIKHAISKGKKQYADGIIINNEGKVMMLLRSAKDGKKELDNKWSLPGGHIDQGETAEQAVRREVLEETNYVVESCSQRFVKETKDCAIHFFTCTVSQDQIEILNAAEHTNCKWVNKEELQKLDCIFDLKETLNELIFPEFELLGYNIANSISADYIKLAMKLPKYADITLIEANWLWSKFDKLENTKKTREGQYYIDIEYTSKNTDNSLTKTSDGNIADSLEKKGFGYVVGDSFTAKDKALEFMHAVRLYSDKKDPLEKSKEMSPIDAAMMIIKKAFDEDQITAEQYYNALKKSQLFNNVAAADKLFQPETQKVEINITVNTEKKEEHIVNAEVASPIIKYLNQLINLNARDTQKKFYEWQLQNAKPIKLTPIAEIRKLYPKIDQYLKVEFGVMKQSYMNASKLCINCEGVKYIEGFMYINGVPFECAFNKIDDCYFDVTKDVADISLRDNANDVVDDCIAVMELSKEEVIKYALEAESYSSFLKNKFLDEHKVEKSDKPVVVQPQQQEQVQKLILNKYTDEELENHAHRSSMKDLEKVIKEGRNPRLREIAAKHLATRQAKQKEHSLYDLMIVEESDQEHHYSKDENTIHFDKQPDDDILASLNAHGVKYIVHPKEKEEQK